MGNSAERLELSFLFRINLARLAYQLKVLSRLSDPLQPRILKMFSQVLFFLIFVTVTSAFLQALDVGDPCQTVGRKGVCTLGDDCPGYSKAIRTQEFLENRCNFRGNQIVVCCPLRKSVEACERHKSRPSKIITFDDHIVNGEEADKGDFPQFVALGYAADNGNMSYDCGGVLISERFVLTAAHCLNRRLILARFGIISMKDDQRANIYKVDMTIKVCCRTICDANMNVENFYHFISF